MGKMGQHDFSYEPIVQACRSGCAPMVSFLLELGVELADVGRPGRRLDWYKQYLQDDEVDARLTALLPAELGAKTNKEVRQEQDRVKAAQEAEKQRLRDEESKKRRSGAEDCVRCNVLFFPNLPGDHKDQPGPCQHHNGKTLCSEEGRGFMTGWDGCCKRSCCWDERRSEGCCTTAEHSITDTMCETCGAWHGAASTTEKCSQHSGRYISCHMINQQQQNRKKIVEKLALLADPDMPVPPWGVRREIECGDPVRIRAGASIKCAGITHDSVGWVCGYNRYGVGGVPMMSVHFPDAPEQIKGSYSCEVSDLEYAKPPNFDADAHLLTHPHWSCCGNVDFRSEGCVVREHKWKAPYNPDPNRSSIPSIMRIINEDA